MQHIFINMGFICFLLKCFLYFNFAANKKCDHLWEPIKLYSMLWKRDSPQNHGMFYYLWKQNAFHVKWNEWFATKKRYSSNDEPFVWTFSLKRMFWGKIKSSTFHPKRPTWSSPFMEAQWIAVMPWWFFVGKPERSIVETQLETRRMEGLRSPLFPGFQEPFKRFFFPIQQHTHVIFQCKKNGGQKTTWKGLF